MHCPYEGVRNEAGEAVCNVLSVSCGFSVGMGPKLCARCIQARAWNDADVPQFEPDDVEQSPSKSDAQRIVRGNAFFGEVFKQTLRGRLICGDSARYQKEAPFDMDKAFAAFHTKFGDLHAEDVLAEMLDYQVRKAKSNAENVHDEATVRAKISTLAETHGFITSEEAESLRRM